jgi:ABC-type branched-subunit amino acid transport system ATPase component
VSALLSVRGTTKSFGGIRALEGCSFDVEEGSIRGLIGPNGSGKTTAFDFITGTSGLTAAESYCAAGRSSVQIPAGCTAWASPGHSNRRASFRG